jgi:circadian clock protein KaiC
MLDDRSSDPGDLHLHSIAHGVITLEQAAQEYGSERRRLRVVKMRGVKYRGGFHDFCIEKGGVSVFPRLVAAEHHATSARCIDRLGPTWTRCWAAGCRPAPTPCLTARPASARPARRCAALSAMERGEKAAYYLFDEGRTSWRAMPLYGHGPAAAHRQRRTGLVHQIDPAELSPGEFASWIRAVGRDRRRQIHRHRQPERLSAGHAGREHYLLLQMHEMLSYLNQQGVITLLILGQHGIIGDVRSEVDLSYLSDTIILYRYFEAQGNMLKAMSVAKSRTTAARGQHPRFRWARRSADRRCR